MSLGRGGDNQRRFFLEVRKVGVSRSAPSTHAHTHTHTHTRTHTPLLHRSTVSAHESRASRVCVDTELSSVHREAATRPPTHTIHLGQNPRTTLAASRYGRGQPDRPLHTSCTPLLHGCSSSANLEQVFGVAVVRVTCARAYRVFVRPFTTEENRPCTGWSLSRSPRSRGQTRS